MPATSSRNGTSAPPGGFVRCALPLILAIALATTLGSCTGGEPAVTPTTTRTSPPAPTPSAVPAADPAALAEAARTAGTPVRAGDLTLRAAAPLTAVTVTAQDDGSAVLTFAVAPAPDTEPGDGTDADRLAAVLAAPPGLGFDVRTDRSVALTGSTGTVVGALPPARVVDAAGNRLSARLAARAGDPTLLDVLVGAGPAGAATLTFGATPLVSAVWGDREGGRSLAVVPATWVRTGGVAAQEALWSALVAAEPDADSTSMHDQLTCHALGAPTKDSWNLEPWRPAVDSLTLLATRCNP